MRSMLPDLIVKNDVTEKDNFLFKLACQEGHVYLVELLLTDGRIKPKVGLPYARGQTSIVNLLEAC